MTETVTLVAACFADLPEQILLATAATGIVTVVWIEERTRIQEELSSRGVDLLILPLADRNAESSLPVAVHCSAAIRNLHVVMLLSRNSSDHHTIAAAIQAGVDVVTTRSAEELRALLQKFSGLRTPSVEEYAAVDFEIRGLPRATLAKWFAVAVHAIPRLRSVGDYCRMIGVPRRTFIRRFKQGGWPSPAESLDWARLIRAAMMLRLGARSPRALARAGGFDGEKALSTASRSLLGVANFAESALAPTTIVQALRARVRVTPPSTLSVEVSAE